METSAKTGLNAKELFVEAAKLLYQDYNIYKTKKAKKQGEKLKKGICELTYKTNIRQRQII